MKTITMHILRQLILFVFMIQSFVDSTGLTIKLQHIEDDLQDLARYFVAKRPTELVSDIAYIDFKPFSTLCVSHHQNKYLRIDTGFTYGSPTTAGVGGLFFDYKLKRFYLDLKETADNPYLDLDDPADNPGRLLDSQMSVTFQASYRKHNSRHGVITYSGFKTKEEAVSAVCNAEGIHETDWFGPDVDCTEPVKNIRVEALSNERACKDLHNVRYVKAKMSTNPTTSSQDLGEEGKSTTKCNWDVFFIWTQFQEGEVEKKRGEVIDAAVNEENMDSDTSIREKIDKGVHRLRQKLDELREKSIK